MAVHINSPFLDANPLRDAELLVDRLFADEPLSSQPLAEKLACLSPEEKKKLEELLLPALRGNIRPEDFLRRLLDTLGSDSVARDIAIRYASHLQVSGVAAEPNKIGPVGALLLQICERSVESAALQAFQQGDSFVLTSLKIPNSGEGTLVRIQALVEHVTEELKKSPRAFGKSSVSELWTVSQRHALTRIFKLSQNSEEIPTQEQLAEVYWDYVLTPLIKDSSELKNLAFRYDTCSQQATDPETQKILWETKMSLHLATTEEAKRALSLYPAATRIQRQASLVVAEVKAKEFDVHATATPQLWSSAQRDALFRIARLCQSPEDTHRAFDDNIALRIYKTYVIPPLLHRPEVKQILREYQENDERSPSGDASRHFFTSFLQSLLERRACGLLGLASVHDVREVLKSDFAQFLRDHELPQETATAIPTRKTSSQAARVARLSRKVNNVSAPGTNVTRFVEEYGLTIYPSESEALRNLTTISTEPFLIDLACSTEQALNNSRIDETTNRVIYDTNEIRRILSIGAEPFVRALERLEHDGHIFFAVYGGDGMTVYMADKEKAKREAGIKILTEAAELSQDRYRKLHAPHFGRSTNRRESRFAELRAMRLPDSSAGNVEVTVYEDALGDLSVFVLSGTIPVAEKLMKSPSSSIRMQYGVPDGAAIQEGSLEVPAVESSGYQQRLEELSSRFKKYFWEEEGSNCLQFIPIPLQGLKFNTWVIRLEDLIGEVPISDLTAMLRASMEESEIQNLIDETPLENADLIELVLASELEEVPRLMADAIAEAVEATADDTLVCLDSTVLCKITSLVLESTPASFLEPEHYRLSETSPPYDLVTLRARASELYEAIIEAAHAYAVVLDTRVEGSHGPFRKNKIQFLPHIEAYFDSAEMMKLILRQKSGLPPQPLHGDTRTIISRREASAQALSEAFNSSVNIRHLLRLFSSDPENFLKEFGFEAVLSMVEELNHLRSIEVTARLVTTRKRTWARHCTSGGSRKLILSAITRSDDAPAE